MKSFLVDSAICLIPVVAVWRYGADAGSFLLLAAIFLRLGHIEQRMEQSNLNPAQETLAND